MLGAVTGALEAARGTPWAGRDGDRQCHPTHNQQLQRRRRDPSRQFPGRRRGPDRKRRGHGPQRRPGASLGTRRSDLLLADWPAAGRRRDRDGRRRLADRTGGYPPAARRRADSGIAEIAPLPSRPSRLALAPIRFAAARDARRRRTVLLVDGPSMMVGCGRCECAPGPLRPAAPASPSERLAPRSAGHKVNFERSNSVQRGFRCARSARRWSRRPPAARPAGVPAFRARLLVAGSAIRAVRLAARADASRASGST